MWYWKYIHIRMFWSKCNHCFVIYVLFILPFKVLLYTLNPADSTCQFEDGDGTGAGSWEKYIGSAESEDGCESLVNSWSTNVENQRPNGATWGVNTNSCYAEFGAKEITGAIGTYRTCIFEVM